MDKKFQLRRIRQLILHSKRKDELRKDLSYIELVDFAASVINDYEIIDKFEIKDNHCQLCDTKILNNFFIENKNTNDELIVGSECIEKWEFDDVSEYAKKQFERFYTFNKHIIARLKLEISEVKKRIYFESKYKFIMDDFKKLKTFDFKGLVSPEPKIRLNKLYDLYLGQGYLTEIKLNEFVDNLNKFKQDVKYIQDLKDVTKEYEEHTQLINTLHNLYKEFVFVKKPTNLNPVQQKISNDFKMLKQNNLYVLAVRGNDSKYYCSLSNINFFRKKQNELSKFKYLKDIDIQDIFKTSDKSVDQFLNNPKYNPELFKKFLYLVYKQKGQHTFTNSLFDQYQIKGALSQKQLDIFNSIYTKSKPDTSMDINSVWDYLETNHIVNL